MARINISGLDGMSLSLDELAELPDRVIEEMLNAQADIVERAQKETGKRYGVHRTGVTLESIKRKKMKKTKDGAEMEVVPQGNNARGNSNAMVAFFNEYGVKGKQSARPFIRTANRASAGPATEAAERIYGNWVDQTMTRKD